jgi:hypothetical protein
MILDEREIANALRVRSAVYAREVTFSATAVGRVRTTHGCAMSGIREGLNNSRNLLRSGQSTTEILTQNRLRMTLPFWFAAVRMTLSFWLAALSREERSQSKFSEDVRTFDVSGLQPSGFWGR